VKNLDIFWKKYKNEKEAKKEIILQQVKAHNLKKQLHELSLPTDLQEKKERIGVCRSIVNDLMSHRDLKGLIDSFTFLEIMKKCPHDVVNYQNWKLIYDFLFDYKESSASKKKRKDWESSMDFFKKHWDYTLGSFISFLSKQERELNEKIFKYKAKNKDILAHKVSNDLDHVLHQDVHWDLLKKEALDIFIDKIKRGEIKNFRDRYYSKDDLDDISRIQPTIDKRTYQTIPSLDFATILGNEEQEKNTILKSKNISVSPKNYYEIKWNIDKFRKWTQEQTQESLRGYIFDRLIEYIWIEIINYRIKKIIDTHKYYKWTSFRILKTDFMDDTYWWADLVILFKFPWNKDQREEIAAVDLLTSQTKYWKKSFEDQDPSKKEKEKKAEEPKFIYSTYVKLANESPLKRFVLSPLKRIVIEEDAMMTYYLLSQLIKWELQDRESCIEHYINETKPWNKNIGDESDFNIFKIIKWEYHHIKIAS
jgi:hypothetical protein